MDKAASLLPNSIEQASKGTPVAMLMQVVDRENIEAFLAIELTKLASLINVDERLNLQGHQMPFIASQLVDLHKSETLADFRICFQRGATGRYDDKLLRLDLAIICNWMRKYLEEKYEVIENQLMKEKDNIYKVKRDSPEVPVQINPERNILAAFETVIDGKDAGIDLSKYLTPEELKEVELARRNASKQTDTTNAGLNAYPRWKLVQNDIRKAEKVFYKGNIPAETNRYDDDKGHYVHAVSLEDAEAIYNLATKEK